ncbi:F-box/kelch-repeat protein At3g06240-like [Apium graveolens]|uniref:F-box/kelch-repeat protein At3g06240-like n=1 Tax=Apium graveolens TaxID=4045 RepID=UPI003D79E88F
MAKKGKGGNIYRRPTRPSHTSSSSSDLSSQQHLTGKSLPEDLIVEILCRTLAKSLVRFRCVCKSWLSLTHHPKFIDMHLKRNLSQNKRLVLHGFAPNLTARVMCLFHVDEPLVPLYELKRNYVRRSDYPDNFSFAEFFDEMEFCGSVNGIICLSHSQNEEGGRHVSWGSFAVLWNPAINRTKLVSLPPRKSLFDIWQMVSVGLGYDAANDDYKIIRLVSVAIPDVVGHIESRVEIYSSNKDCWKPVCNGAKINFYPRLPNCSFIVKGVPYWHNDKLGLGAFDPRTGMYKNIPYPRFVKNERTEVHPVNMMDKVSALVYSPGEIPNQMVDLYVLDSSGLWIKGITTGPIAGEALRMPQCLTTGEIVVEMWKGETSDYRSTFFYDPKTSHCSSKFVAFQSLWYQSYCHVESLVSVKGMEPFGNESKNKKKPWTKNRDKYLSEGFKLVLRFYEV